ncbi:c-type cytochrome biogenesis protein CcmI [Noviherbaspirillum sp. CPCC 100848]|uniref:C-type cytochrome biogenesis protein CcmI n=1 Tax=Noviherbaspirillum album TaxID=3080276 RepID=A0ABU6JIW0_9BURK|nr:c-type cytochrome biogenesis protein CcmI [Noviherbaspirillum sp. CPCC 100848]MEC4723635.1 c-type cytochrome biogenesis protein CcmI [Noviherbaspirillum sp. CPCC 100848]
MTVFLLGAAALVITVLAFLLPPLLRSSPGREDGAMLDESNLAVLRDQMRELEADRARGLINETSFAHARNELRQRVNDEVRPDTQTIASAGRWGAPLIAFIVPISAMLMYVVLGTPAAFVTANTEAHAPQSMDAAVQNLAKKLEAQPDNVDGWHILARSYNALERYEDALNAYAQLARLVPDDADVLTDYADTLAMVKDRSLQGEPEKLIERALAIDPDNVKAIALAGTAAFERKDYSRAIVHWEKMMALVPPESELATSTAGSIQEAKRMLDPGAAAEETASNQAAAIKPASIGGVVELDPALRARVADTDTVFIFARAVDGTAAPIAVIRATAKELPLKFMLDDQTLMIKSRKLSDHKQVIVGARISRSGNALSSPDALAGMMGPVAVGTKDIRIRISEN